MSQSAMRVILRTFEEPDDVRRMEKGRYEVVRIGGQVLGRATYEPCWRWSEHVGPPWAQPVVASSTWAWCRRRFDHRTAATHQLFYIAPVPHDGWVVGAEPL